MLLNPAILALVGVSAVLSLMVLAAAGFALQVLRHWDLASGSARQLRLERRTYLIATLLTHAFGAGLLGLLLFIYNAERMSTQFVGAMCATGVLNINAYGWPTLFLKLAVFFLGAIWLALNRLDSQGYDYPLVRVKYALLLLMVPVVLAEALVQLRYFLGLDPEVITSCCGSLFGSAGRGVAAEVAAAPPLPTMVVFYALGLAAFASGGWFLWRRGGGWLFAALSVAVFVVAMVAVLSFISIYVYEQPHHHCPFCLLKAGHDYLGYFLYLPLFAATASGLATGAALPFAAVPSLRAVVVAETRRFTILALIGLALFYLVASYAVLASHLILFGPA